MFRDVLVGLDGSHAADRALAEAIALAEQHGGRLTILTAVPAVRLYGGPPEAVAVALDVGRALERDAVALQRAAVARVPASMPVTTILRHGSPLKALVEELEQGRHDVLILGASERRHHRRRRLADRVMSHVDASVLVVGPEPPVQRLLERASRRLRWSSQRRLRARQSER